MKYFIFLILNWAFETQWVVYTVAHLRLDQPRQALSSPVKLTATILDSPTTEFHARPLIMSMELRPSVLSMLTFLLPSPSFTEIQLTYNIVLVLVSNQNSCSGAGREPGRPASRPLLLSGSSQLGSWGRVWFASIATQPNGLGEYITMKGIKEEGLQPKQPGIWVLSNYQCCFKMKGAKMCKTP